MGKKGKGRQSGCFASKSLKANHHQEVKSLRDETLQWTRKETAGFVAWSNAHQKQQRRLLGVDHQFRPSFAMALRRNLNGILHERQARQSYHFRERRRRNGFLPSDDTTTRVSGFDGAHETNVSNGIVHPSGWLLRHNNTRNSDTDTDNDETYHKDNNDSVPSLQSLSLIVFARYIRDYRNAMGDEELYGALSILPPESITDISIFLSSEPTTSYNNSGKSTEKRIEKKRIGRRRNRSDVDNAPPVLYMDDDMAMLLGQHQHVDHLCLRSKTSATTGRASLTNSGLKSLIPRTPTLLRRKGGMRRRQKRKEETHDRDTIDDNDESSNSCGTDDVLECWEDDDDDESFDDNDNDEYYDDDEFAFGSKVEEDLSRHGTSGCNLRLRRLELLDLSCCSDNTNIYDVDDNGNATTASILLQWFETCSGITHLSLAGSFKVHHEVGRTILLSLPRVLPALEVLDVTRCPWATDSLLQRMMGEYFQNNANHKDSTTDNDNHNGHEHLDSTRPSARDLLPTVYCFRGRFEWLPEASHNAVETDFWDEAS